MSLKHLKPFLVVSYEFCMTVLFSLPRYRLVCYFKKLLLCLMGAKVGSGLIIYPGVWIMTGRNLVIGNDVDLSKDVIITTEGGVTIGDRVLIGYRTQILSSNHEIPAVGIRIPVSGTVHKAIFIEHDAWIGANCVITAGVRIGHGAVVGAGSVVTKDVAPNSIVAGVPARLIRMRESEAELYKAPTIL